MSSLYEVEQILEQRLLTKGSRKIVQYKVKWKGYSADESTWEPEKNLLSCDDMLQDFKSNQKMLFNTNAISLKEKKPSPQQKVTSLQAEEQLQNQSQSDVRSKCSSSSFEVDSRKKKKTILKDKSSEFYYEDEDSEKDQTLQSTEKENIQLKKDQEDQNGKAIKKTKQISSIKIKKKKRKQSSLNYKPNKEDLKTSIRDDEDFLDGLARKGKRIRKEVEKAALESDNVEGEVVIKDVENEEVKKDVERTDVSIQTEGVKMLEGEVQTYAEPLKLSAEMQTEEQKPIEVEVPEDWLPQVEEKFEITQLLQDDQGKIWFSANRNGKKIIKKRNWYLKNHSIALIYYYEQKIKSINL